MGLSSSFWALAFLGVLGQQSVLGQEMGSKERPARSCHEILLERGMVADGYQHLRLPSGVGSLRRRNRPQDAVVAGAVRHPALERQQRSRTWAGHHEEKLPTSV